MMRLVDKALQPQSGTEPLLACFAQVDDRLAKGVGNHCGGAFPQTVIRLSVVGVGAQLEGEDEEGAPDCLEGMRMTSVGSKVCPGLGDLIERPPLGVREGEGVVTGRKSGQG